MRNFSQYLQLQEATYSQDAIMRLTSGFKTYIEKILPNTKFALFAHPLKYTKSGIGDSFQIPLLNTNDADGICLSVCYEPRRQASVISSINVYLKGWSTDKKPSYELVLNSETNLVKIAAEVANILRGYEAEKSSQSSMTMEGYLLEIRRDAKTGLALDPARRKAERETAAEVLKKAIADAKKHGIDVNTQVDQELAPNALETGVPSDMHEEVSAEEQYENMTILVNQVVKNEQKSLIIVGSAGVGKTYNVMQIVRKSGRPYQQVKGNVASELALYNILFANRREDDFLIFDDADSIFSYSNLLKGALGDDSDPSAAYVVNYVSQGSVENISKWPENKKMAYYDLYDLKIRGEGDLYQEKLQEYESLFASDPRKFKAMEKGHILAPSNFQFLGNMIIISNKKLSDFMYNEHLKAIVSRGAFFSLDLTQDTVFNLLEKLLPTFENSKVSITPMQKKELFEIVKDIYETKYPSDDKFPSFRNFVMLFPWMADDSIEPAARKKYIMRQIAIWNA